MTTMKPVIVSFDGNIGSGKSSILHYFEKNFKTLCDSKQTPYKICFLQEPVQIWETIQDEDGKNIIEKFYQDNERYSFAFQMMAYISRLSLLKKALSEDYDIIFTERSMFTDRNVFAKMLYDSGKLGEIEYQIYNKWFDEFVDYLMNMKVVYIKTDSIICNLRVKNRARIGESIPLEYLQNCHKYHEEWLKIDKENTLIFNGNMDIDTNTQSGCEIYNSSMEQVYDFIQ